jgi:hypothetical protein
VGRSAAHGSITAKLRENQEARHMRAAFPGLTTQMAREFPQHFFRALRSFRGIA